MVDKNLINSESTENSCYEWCNLFFIQRNSINNTSSYPNFKVFLPKMKRDIRKLHY